MAHSKSEQRQRCHQLQNDGVESHRQAISQTFLSKDSGAKFDMPPARVGPRQSHTTGTIPFELLDRLIYAPKGYYLVEDRYRRPWGVMLRIFLVNLPHQEGSYSHEPERWEDETCNDSGDEKETDKWFHALETAPDTKKGTPEYLGVITPQPTHSWLWLLVWRHRVGRTCVDAASSGGGASCLNQSYYLQDGNRTAGSPLRM